MADPTAVPTGPLDAIGTVTDYAELVPTFDRIIRWAIDAQTPIGYFAVIYRQATVAIREAIENGEFEDPMRMRKFQLVFAQRYFDALDLYNGHAPVFAPRGHVWQQCFDDSGLDKPIIFQHLLTALNAHMNLDLGVAAAVTARDHAVPMRDLRKDFDVVNGVLGNQVESVLDAMDEISPFIKFLRRLAPCEVQMFRALIIFFRETAWTFALKCAAASDMTREIRLHDAKFDDLGTNYIYTPGVVTPLVDKIARRESRDISRNIKALNKIAPPAWSTITAYRQELDELAAN